MPDSPSPVRASAQATEPWLDLREAFRAKWREYLCVQGVNSEVVKSLLTDVDGVDRASEARGRQQAEQARDDREAQWQSCLDASESRVAALTQALKDYGQHKLSCQLCQRTVAHHWGEDKDGELSHGVTYEKLPDAKCTCGLYAALTGAQA